MSELVINQATWMDNGLPVKDTVALENPGGLTVNVETTGEEPLRLPRCACNASDRQAEGDVPPRPDSNYGNLPGLFGSAPNGTERQYDDLDAAEMARRRGKLRADLGLRDEDENPERGTKAQTAVDVGVQPMPGFPLRSRLGYLAPETCCK
jgi:hypothetical protein